MPSIWGENRGITDFVLKDMHSATIRQALYTVTGALSEDDVCESLSVTQ